MTNFWRGRLEPIIWNWTQLQQSPLEEAFRGVRTEIPVFDLLGAGTPAASLHWSGNPVHVSESLDAAFWEFMTLPDAPDENIVRFARRFGPLMWPGAAPATTAHMHLGRDTSQVSRDQQLHGRPFVEPLSAWRLYARGLRTLYDLLDPTLPRDAMDADTRTWSITAIAMPIWLQEAESRLPALTEELVLNVAMELALGDHFPEPGIAPPERLLERALAVAGVGPAYLPDRSPASGLVYAVPATASQSPESGRIWQVRGLAPILTVSLAFAARTQERPRCTWCGNPAAILTRAPRRGQPWFGDHVMCRAEARAKTMRTAEDKRSRKRKLRAEHDRAGATLPTTSHSADAGDA